MNAELLESFRKYMDHSFAVSDLCRDMQVTHITSLVDEIVDGMDWTYFELVEKDHAKTSLSAPSEKDCDHPFCVDGHIREIYVCNICNGTGKISVIETVRSDPNE